MPFRILLLAALAFSAAGPALAADDPLSPSARYHPGVPTVEAVLGYRVGESFTPHHQLERYYRELAAASDRVRLEPYGRSIEGRTLYLVIITSPENHARLDSIRAATGGLSDPRQTPPTEAEALIEGTPVVVWLSYGVHGNESVSAEAALQVAYELAASADERVAEWLGQAVVLLDPIVNPDGHERYVHYYQTALGAHPNPDRFAAEHFEQWPGGRTNHYLFDLNRDWAWQTQPESVARVRAYRRWNPQVHIDYHEMSADSTYFFFPPTEPVHELLAPHLSKWFETYGRGNARAFDRYGFRYYTRENFDTLYPGYGDSWPAFNGAVGMTYEQAGGGRAGLVIDLAEGERRLTLRDRAARHFVSSLATIQTSVENRQDRLRAYYDFHRAALAAGREGPAQMFFLPPGPDPERLAHAIEILLRQGIEVQRAGEEFSAEGLTNHWGETVRRQRFPAGTFVVDLEQPAGFLARAMLEREAKLGANFFYDVVAWSMPLAVGIEAYAGRRPKQISLAPLAEPPALEGQVEAGASPVAYVFSWESGAAARLLGLLLGEGIKAYASLEAFKLEGRGFPAGSIVVPAESNSPDLGERLHALAVEAGCHVFGTSTLRSEEGIDLGSERMRFLRPPRVAILTDSPTSSLDYGALWYLFDQRLGLPFTAVRAEMLGGVDLAAYNVLILPSDFGDGRGYARAMGKSQIEQLRDWLTKGGVLISLRGGAVFTARDNAGLTTVGYRYIQRRDELARQQKERQQAESEERKEPEREAEQPAGPDRRLLSWAEREEAQREEEIPGTILRVKLDATHPLAFGLGEQLAVLNRTAPILELTSVGDNVAYYPDSNLKLSGFLTPENEQKLAHTAYLLREPVGRGQVVLFADSPLFRGFWDGSERLLLNAVFFGHITHPELDY